MATYAPGRILARSILISVALHAVLTSPFLLLRQARPKSEQLVMELYGMISDRQLTEKDLAARQPPQPQQQEKQRQEKQKDKERDQRKTQADSPVKQAMDEKPLEKPTSTAPPTPATPIVAAGSDDNRQKQQTMQQLTSEDLNRLYSAKVSKKVNANITYPAVVKKRGYEGNPVVRFTVVEDGSVRSGSLAISKSSGYAEVDAAALKAVQDSEPFDRPDSQKNIVITLFFSSGR